MSTELTAQDRCDTCESRALVAAKVNDVWLKYCGHHAMKYEAKLRLVASEWHDERDQTNSFVPELTSVS